MSEIFSTIIRIKDNEASVKAANWCWQTASANIEPKFFNAVVPSMVDDMMHQFRLKWTYPWEGERLDVKSGLTLRAYPTADPKKRMACFLSHYILWGRIVDNNQPCLVLEHDAEFLSKRPLPIKSILMSPFDIIGINNPFGATRLSHVFDAEVRNSTTDVARAPQIDSPNIPQGLAGNSAYIIKPAGAQHMINLVEEHGAWPNDAIMCRQLVPKLGVTKKYYTATQRIRSTTTL